jgi:DNA-binding transcriptional MerR regulator
MPDDRRITAKTVGETTGLSYRQLHDWEKRGVAPAEEERGLGWRKFTPRELFALMICAEIRKRLGVPVERLAYIRQFMLQDGADHLRAAVELMAMLGMPVWLVTDLTKTFILDSEMEFRDLVQLGYLGGDHEQTLIWVKVSPLVNRLLGCLKEPIHLESHGRGYAILRTMREATGVKSPQEFEVLQHIRSGDFDSIEVVMRDGNIRRIKGSKDLKDADKQDLTEILQQSDFQTLIVTQRGGKTVHINQTTVNDPSPG